ncbi:MAG: cupredoxin domain-containing protein [Bdellovibrionales bacterium]|nr:cupredoxin domain-containing protein [Bdellovibrionales bacterium]
MKILKMVAWGAMCAVLMGATPPESGYSVVPKKGSGGSKSLKDEAVRPEEAFKYGVQEFSLIATDTGYLPSKVIARKNIPVRLFVTSASARNLCIVLDEFSVKKGVQAQKVEEIRLLPTAVGQYKFYCPVQQIEGTLVVRD